MTPGFMGVPYRLYGSVTWWILSNGRFVRVKQRLVPMIYWICWWKWNISRWRYPCFDLWTCFLLESQVLLGFHSEFQVHRHGQASYSVFLFVCWLVHRPFFPHGLKNWCVRRELKVYPADFTQTSWEARLVTPKNKDTPTAILCCCLATSIHF